MEERRKNHSLQKIQKRGKNTDVMGVRSSTWRCVKKQKFVKTDMIFCLFWGGKEFFKLRIKPVRLYVTYFFFLKKSTFFLVSLVCSSKVEKSISFCRNKDHLLNFFLFILSSIEMVVGSYKSSFYRCPNFYHHSTIWKRRKNYLVLCQFLRGGRFSCMFSKNSGTIILKKNAFFMGKSTQ